MNPLKIIVIGESTSCGYYDGEEHKNDLNACIPLMVKEAVEQAGSECEIDNRATSSTTIDWQLGIKDGDESEWEPGLIANPPGTLYELAKSKSNVAIIQVGINDAISVDSLDFCVDFITLLQNCKMSGKKIYVAMPNSINIDDNDRLTTIAALMSCAAQIEGVTIVNSGLQNVDMNDDYHPNIEGYSILGNDLKNAIANDAESILNHVTATRFYIAMFNKTPEKGGLDYWSKELSEKGRDEVAQSVVNVTESIIGHMTDYEFISRIYSNLMCRDSDQVGHDYWIDIVESDDINGRGIAMNQMIDVLVNGTAKNGQAYEDQCSLQNRTSAGLSYGYIYEIEDVAEELNLIGVTHDFNSVYEFTKNL